MSELNLLLKNINAEPKKSSWKTFMKIYLVLFVLFLIMFTMRATVTILQVFVPQMSKDFTMTSGEFAVIFTVYNLTAAFFSLFVGPIIERFGYKTALFIGMIIFTTATLITTFAIDFYVIVIGQSLAGLGTAFFGPATIAFAGDYFSKDKISSAIGFIMSSFYIATIVAVPISAYIGDKINWRWGIGIMVIVGGIIVLLIALIIPKLRKEQNISTQDFNSVEKQPKNDNGYFRSIAIVLKNKYAIGTFFITLFQRGGLFAMTTILSDWVLKGFGLNITYSGLILMGSGIASLLSNSFFSWLADKKDDKRNIIIIGTALTGLWIGIFPVLSVNLAVAVFGFILLNFFGGISMGSFNAHVAEVESIAKGTAVSINNSFGQMSQALAVAVIVRIIYNRNDNYIYAGYTAMAFYVVATILMLYFIKSNKNK